MRNAGYQGGAIFFTALIKMTLLNNTFTNNTSTLYGPTLAAPPNELLWIKRLSHITLYSGDFLLPSE
jgi:hypothetical protein